MTRAKQSKAKQIENKASMVWIKNNNNNNDGFGDDLFSI